MGHPNIAFPDAQSFASMSFANENLSKQQEFEGIVGCSMAPMKTSDLIRTAAPTDSRYSLRAKQEQARKSSRVSFMLAVNTEIESS